MAGQAHQCFLRHLARTMAPKPQHKETSSRIQGFMLDDTWRSEDSSEGSEDPSTVFGVDDDLDQPTELDPYELHKRLQVLKLQREQEAKRQKFAQTEKNMTAAKASKDHADNPATAKAFSKLVRKAGEDGQENQDPSRKTRRPHSGYLKVLEANRDESPDSQVIESGVCSPRSEGIWRANRKDIAHWPADMEKRSSKTG